MNHYQNILTRITAMFLCLCLLMGMPICAEAAAFGPAYDGQAATNYAAAHWDDGVGVCDQFVKACLQAGGVEILAGGVDPLKNALLDAKLGTETNLVISSDGVHALASENPGVQPGDVLFFYCRECQRSIHTAIIGGVSESGYLYSYAHNPGWDKVDWFGNFKHSVSDTEKHSDCFSFSVVAMDRSAYSHTHNFTSNLYEETHPHNMYAQCSCGAKYYLGWNATVSYCTVCNPPMSTIPVVTATAEDDCIRLQWTTVENAIEYQVLRARSQSETFYTIFSGMSTTMTNTSVEAGITYRYKVVAVLEKDSAGNVIRSAESEIVSCKLPAATILPDPPVITLGHNMDGKPTLSWTAVPGAAQYKIFRCKTENGKYANVFTTAGKTYTHASATAGETYFYYVSAVLEDGTTIDSNTVTSTCIAPAEPFVITTGNNVDGKPTLKWNAAPNADHYEVYRSTSKSGNYVRVFSTAGKSYTHTSATAGKTYYYKIKIVFANGTSQFSDVVSNYCRIPEVKFEITTGHNASGKPTMKWIAIPGASNYEVYRSNTKSGTYSKVFTTKGTSYTNSSAQAGNTYYYKLKVNLTDGTQAISGILENTCLIPEVEFDITTGHNASGKPTMKWKAIPGGQNYEVYRATSEGGNYVKVFTTKGTTYTHSSATAGRTYYYKLKVNLVDGTSKISSILTNTCNATS